MFISKLLVIAFTASSGLAHPTTTQDVTTNNLERDFTQISTPVDIVAKSNVARDITIAKDVLEKRNHPPLTPRKTFWAGNHFVFAAKCGVTILKAHGWHWPNVHDGWFRDRVQMAVDSLPSATNYHVIELDGWQFRFQMFSGLIFRAVNPEFVKTVINEAIVAGYNWNTEGNRFFLEFRHQATDNTFMDLEMQPVAREGGSVGAALLWT
jgi:hypothetical protein